MRLFTTIIALLICLTNAMAQELHTIKFHNLKKKPIIEAEVNGKQAFFLIDTGSDISILNKGDASKYHFKNIRMQEDGHKVSGLGTLVDEFWRAGKVKVTLDDKLIYARFYSMDIDNIINSLYKNTNIRILGILGSDVLINYSMNIDYQNEQLTMIPR